MRLIFTRTMAAVEDAQGHITYHCMACVRREMPLDKLAALLSWLTVHTGAGMFAFSWRLVQGRFPCTGCEE